MFLTLLKRAVKAALHGGVEEWALESGLPRAVVDEMRTKRLALAIEADARADAAAVKALGVVDDDPPLDRLTMTAVPMSSAARITVSDACPVAGGDDAAFFAWVERQRQAQIGWDEIAKAAADAGHALNGEALRGRYRRWRDKTLQSDNPASS